MNYRAQWTSIPGSFRQIACGYDQPVYFGKSLNGLGGLVTSDVAGEGHLAKVTVLLNYAFAIEMGRRGHEHYLRFGLSGGLEQASINMLKLRFSDQIDPRDGFIRATQEPLNLNSRLNPDVNAGIAWYNKYCYAAFSVHHLTEPKQVFIGLADPTIDPHLPMRFTGTAGIKIPAGPINDREKITVSPNLLFMKQRNFNQLNVGTYVTVEPIVFGAWYRSNFNNFNGQFQSDMIAGLVGFTQGALSVGYSYDYTLSRLTNGISGGSHEIAVIMKFEKNRKIKFKHRDTPCPHF
jgi:type IX secretion system PorP/SprF family membrane protein